jgi:hypothetical protein
MTDEKLLRFAAVLVVLAGYVFVFRAGEARLAARIAENADMAERVRESEHAPASRTALAAERARLREQLRSANVAADRGTLVARFVRDAAAIARAHRTAITTITASAPAASAMSASVPAASAMSASVPAASAISASRPAGEPSGGVPFEMTVEGRYADVLATIRALPSGHALASVDVTSIARKNLASTDGTLTASLRVLLEPIAPAPVSETAGAATRPV